MSFMKNYASSNRKTPKTKNIKNRKQKGDCLDYNFMHMNVNLLPIRSMTPENAKQEWFFPNEIGLQASFKYLSPFSDLFCFVFASNFIMTDAYYLHQCIEFSVIFPHMYKSYSSYIHLLSLCPLSPPVCNFILFFTFYQRVDVEIASRCATLTGQTLNPSTSAPHTQVEWVCTAGPLFVNLINNKNTCNQCGFVMQHPRAQNALYILFS